MEGRDLGAEFVMAPLISVIGPVEPPLLRAFAQHYLALGVDRLLLGFHFPDDLPRQQEVELVGACEEFSSPEILSRGAWRADTNGRVRDELRRRAGKGWHVLADVDEFQFHPESIQATIELARSQDAMTVEGLLFDRVTASGKLEGWSEEIGLDRTYSFGGFFTHRVLKGDSRKIVLAHSDVILGSGQHYSPRVAPVLTSSPLPVHHFKWRRDAQAYMRRRAQSFASSNIADEMSMREEALRILLHLEGNQGRIDVQSSSLRFRTVDLMSWPQGWHHEALEIQHYWRDTHWLA